MIIISRAPKWFTDKRNTHGFSVLIMVCLRVWDYILWIGLQNIFLHFLGSSGTVIWRQPHEEKLLRDFSYHEEVVPVISHGHNHITSTKTQVGHLGAITLTFTAYNTTFVVDLQINSYLFSNKYIEKRFSEGKAIINNDTRPHESHCYYHGHLRNDPTSIVAISTCQGVRGSIFGTSGVYHLEPTQSVINGQHFVFSDSHQRSKELMCGHKDDIFTGFHTMNNENRKHHRLKRSIVRDWPYDSTAETRVVEMYIVNDKTEYEEHGSDVTKVHTRTKDIINIVSALYRPIDLYIALVGIEVWEEKDLIDVVENPDNTMNNFLTYRRESITVQHPNDNAQLITGQKLGSGVVGKAPIMTICSWQYSGGVNMDHNMVVGPVATTVAHELGHNFGLSHDTDTCGCPDDRCIMAASSGGIKNPTKWSQCSKRQFADAFEQGMDYCLKNLPHTLKGTNTCGNGFLEVGEECDCGLDQDCNTACCDAVTCRLTENATCATGQCCDLETCKPKPAATVCRTANGPCDLPETCNGKNEFCPIDTYYADGLPCTTESGDTFCYNGKCETHNSQCQLLWGRTGKNSHQQCYKHFNIMGQANGHCGFNWVDKLFTPCRPEDVMCGMLHCVHQNEKLMFWKEALTYTMPEGFVTVDKDRQDCKGVILDVGLDMPDPGMVPDGASCGNQKVCVKQKCVPASTLSAKHCPSCNGHGVCNNHGQCHCEARYAPPFCKTPGNGGSLLSGPMTVSNENVPLIVGLCVLVFIIIPLLIVTIYYGYRNRENLKMIILHGPAEGYRKPRPSSIYHSKPRNDTVNHADRPPSVAMVTRNASSASNHPNSTAAAVHTSNHPRRPEMRRASSFRPQDIGRPQLESSTKSLTGIPTLRHSIGATITDAHNPHAGPTRPAPRLPEGTQNRWSSKAPNAVNIDSPAGSKPSRPPPPKDIGSKLPKRSALDPKCDEPLPPTPDSWYPAPPPNPPVTLGLRGGGYLEGEDYQNLDSQGYPLSSPEFSDVSLDSPPEYKPPPPRVKVNTYINDLNRHNQAHYSTNSSAGKDYRPAEQGGDNQDQDHRLNSASGTPLSVQDRLQKFEGQDSTAKPIRTGAAGVPRTKYKGRPNGAVRTNGIAGNASPNSSSPSGAHDMRRNNTDTKPPVSQKPSLKKHNPKPASHRPPPQTAGRSQSTKDSAC